MDLQNYLIRFAFNGAAYHGFQVQQNAPTVCAAMQDAMARVFGTRPDVKGVSRTDAGVHARDFCLSFFSDTTIPCEKLPLALNSHLPPDIRVHRALPVPADFHARYSALGKEYRYYIHNSPVDDPFTAGFYYRVPHPLDVDAMAEAAAHLEGCHDFASFKGESGDIVENTTRTISAISVGRAGDTVVLAVAADGFLYHMVRILAGTVLEAGLGRLVPGEMPGIIAAKNRTPAGPTLPAKGLFLHKVFYPADIAGG
ncbi:tRNA pseudouridine(38-40) synthase TruA [Ruminococcaceae bacterium OttesenSCG-928-A11]|nr:tRNA pseudouridine(38-40) synthase TruA [Ruminococcaceae bacterium OttesenSCG-928-A11]